MKANIVYTVGHGIQDYAQFFTTLQQYFINVIVDVRRIPYSKYAKKYDKEIFSNYVRSCGLTYMYMGDVLGSVAFDEEYRTGSFIRYDKREQEEEFILGIQRVVHGVDKGYRIVLMCAEQEPVECHRHILLAKSLEVLGVSVSHICKNGQALPAKQFSFSQNLLL